jgi:PIN domain nuclease of toxin-antitoxin system
MTLLLDTHTLLWSIGKSDELSQNVKNELMNPRNKIVVSAISLWEIALKYSVGKLRIDSFDIKDIPKYCEKMGFELLPLEPIEALNSLQLPQKEKHKDPFDRMLIYQCIQNKFTLVSRDSKTALYKEDGLKYLW